MAAGGRQQHIRTGQGHNLGIYQRRPPESRALNETKRGSNLPSMWENGLQNQMAKSSETEQGLLHATARIKIIVHRPGM